MGDLTELKAARDNMRVISLLPVPDALEKVRNELLKAGSEYAGKRMDLPAEHVAILCIAVAHMVPFVSAALTELDELYGSEYEGVYNIPLKSGGTHGNA